MSENKKDSGAEAPKQSEAEIGIKEGRVKLFLDADLKPALKGTFKHHIHRKGKVPRHVLNQWEKRGFKPLKKGVAHVRFADSEKKYTFPAYFEIQKVEA